MASFAALLLLFCQAGVSSAAEALAASSRANIEGRLTTGARELLWPPPCASLMACLRHCWLPPVCCRAHAAAALPCLPG